MEMTTEDRQLLQDTHDAVIALRHSLEPAVKALQKSVWGNGRPGLESRLDVMETERRNCPARIAYIHGHRQTDVAARIAVASIVVAVLAIVVNIVW